MTFSCEAPSRKTFCSKRKREPAKSGQRRGSMLPMLSAPCSAGRLRELLRYDPLTGVFTSLVASSNRKAGQRLGYLNTQGRVYFRLFGRNQFAHRLAWLYMTGQWPSVQIDHIDGNGQNNRFANLRLATATQNAANKFDKKRNTSGFKGVTFVKSRGKWQASIKSGHVSTFLGLFDNPEDAHAAYASAAIARHGEFARLS